MRPQVTGLSQRRRGGGCDWRPRAPHTARGHGDWSLTPQERSLLRVAQTREGNAMDDDRLRWSITRADTRRLSRRQLIEGVAALGLSAQLAAQWLATTGMARAETREPARAAATTCPRPARSCRPASTTWRPSPSTTKYCGGSRPAAERDASR